MGSKLGTYICVKIDLGRKLVSHINVLGHILKLKYEGLYAIHFACEIYGHKQSNWPKTQVKEIGKEVLGEKTLIVTTIKVDNATKEGSDDISPKNFVTLDDGKERNE